MLKYLVFVIIVSSSFSCAQTQPSTLEDVFKYYGTQKVSRLETVAFSFNVQKASKIVRRNWIWHPQTNLVEFRPKGEVVQTFTLYKPTTDPEKILDKKFINDSYWLLFPFQLSRDTTKYTSVFEPNQRSPIRNLKVGKYTITYGDQGYTPGDIYELFVDDNHEIVAWVYRKGGSETPSRITTWEETKSFGGVQISTEHNTANKAFRVWFSDITLDAR